jgi:hypothetical protein
VRLVGRSKINLQINLQNQLGAREQWRSSSKNRSGALTSIGCPKPLSGKRAEIEVASLKFGDQIERNGCRCSVFPMIQRTTSSRLHLRVDHLIRQPREVYVEQQGLELSSLEVIDAEGVRQIVVLRDPMMLPAPSSAKAG